MRAILLDPSCSGSGTTVQRLDHLLPSAGTGTVFYLTEVNFNMLYNYCLNAPHYVTCFHIIIIIIPVEVFRLHKNCRILWWQCGWTFWNILLMDLQEDPKAGPSHPVTNRATCLVSGTWERYFTWYAGSCLVRCTMTATLNSPVSLGHSNSLQPTLNFNPLQGSSLKLVWATLVILWVTFLFYATFVLELNSRCRSEVSRKA